MTKTKAPVDASKRASATQQHQVKSNDTRPRQNNNNNTTDSKARKRKSPSPSNGTEDVMKKKKRTEKVLNAAAKNPSSNWKTLTSSMKDSDKHKPWLKKTSASAVSSSALSLPPSSGDTSGGGGRNQLSRPFGDNSEVTKTLCLCHCTVETRRGTPAVARVVVINSHGHVLFNKHIKPRDKVANFRTAETGLHRDTFSRLKPVSFTSAQEELSVLFKDRIVIGYEADTVFKDLFIPHAYRKTRDLAKYRPLHQTSTASAPMTVDELLGEHLNAAASNRSGNTKDDDFLVQNARGMYLVYKKFRQQWEGGVNKTKRQKPEAKKKKKKPTGGVEYVPKYRG